MRMGSGKEESRKRPCVNCATEMKNRIKRGDLISGMITYRGCCGTWTERDGKVVRPN